MKIIQTFAVILFGLPVAAFAQQSCSFFQKARCTTSLAFLVSDITDLTLPPSAGDVKDVLINGYGFLEQCKSCLYEYQTTLICDTIDSVIDKAEETLKTEINFDVDSCKKDGIVGSIEDIIDIFPSSFLPTSEEMTAVPTAPEIPDDILRAMLKDTATDAGIFDYDEEMHLAIIKESLSAKNGISYGGSLTQVVPTDDTFDGTVFSESSFRSVAIVEPSSVSVASYACDSAILDFAIEAVSLAMSAAGMPGGTGKKVARILVKRAKKKLLKEMKGIVRDYFSSPNPVNIAAGLIKIMSIIVGDIGFNEVTSIIYDAVSWWDAIQIVALLSLYFLSGGGGLAAKLGLMLPSIIDVVETGYDVIQKC